MKNISFFLLFLAFTPLLGFAQNQDCAGAFVRDFQTTDGKITALGKTLADELEAVLLQQNCLVIRRNEQPSLKEQLNLIGNSPSHSDLPDSLNMQLTAVSARLLVSGIIQPGNGGNANITVRFLNLASGQQKITKAIHFSDVELNDAELRQRKLKGQVLGQSTTADQKPLSVDKINDKNELSLFQAFLSKPGRDNAMAYIMNFPNGQYLSKVESSMWGTCLATERRKKCKDFMEIFPESEHIEEAKSIVSGFRAAPPAEPVYEEPVPAVDEMSTPDDIVFDMPTIESDAPKSADGRITNNTQKSRANIKPSNSGGGKYNQIPSKPVNNNSGKPIKDGYIRQTEKPYKPKPQRPTQSSGSTYAKSDKEPDKKYNPTNSTNKPKPPSKPSNSKPIYPSTPPVSSGSLTVTNNCCSTFPVAFTVYNNRGYNRVIKLNAGQKSGTMSNIPAGQYSVRLNIMAKADHAYDGSVRSVQISGGKNGHLAF